jgi:hypothetical protein
MVFEDLHFKKKIMKNFKRIFEKMKKSKIIIMIIIFFLMGCLFFCAYRYNVHFLNILDNSSISTHLMEIKKAVYTYLHTEMQMSNLQKQSIKMMEVENRFNHLMQLRKGAITSYSIAMVSLLFTCFLGVGVVSVSSLILPTAIIGGSLAWYSFDLLKVAYVDLIIKENFELLKKKNDDNIICLDELDKLLIEINELISIF